jgi:hypothetical protein
VLDEEYIFIKRSVSVKDQAPAAKGRPHTQRETLESDNLVLDKNRRQVVQNIINNQEGEEGTKESKKQ